MCGTICIACIVIPYQLASHKTSKPRVYKCMWAWTSLFSGKPWNSTRQLAVHAARIASVTSMHRLIYAEKLWVRHCRKSFVRNTAFVVFLYARMTKSRFFLLCAFCNTVTPTSRHACITEGHSSFPSPLHTCWPMSSSCVSPHTHALMHYWAGRLLVLLWKHRGMSETW